MRSSHALLDLFWPILSFFLLLVWLWLLITIFGDIFRIFRSDMSGRAQEGWTIFVILLSFLGVLIHVIVHGGDMQRRSTRDAVAAEQAQRDYIRSVAGTPSWSAEELAKLADRRDRGAITEQEFATQRAKILV